MAPLTDEQVKAEILREEKQEKMWDEREKAQEAAKSDGDKQNDKENDRKYQLKKAEDHALRGFTYFDNFEDVYNWDATKVDALNKANTPLLKRPDIPDSMKLKEASNLLVMHDYRGAYVEGGYEASQGAIVDRLDYSNEYWQRIEVFNYFSHHRVTIPPPAWINAGHRNGALVLGTFCIETRDGHPHKDSKYILEMKDGKYRLADTLAQMAACYGFDGWLMNIECSVYARGQWNDGHSLEKLLMDLQARVGKVIWYDALTNNNKRIWRNTVTPDNIMFATAAGSIITNYFYDLDDVKNLNPVYKDQATSVEKRLALNNVYSGVDCWGQTDDSDKNPPEPNTRQTFGFNNETGDGDGESTVGKGHGGTATGLAVKALGKLGLGVGIFAQAWAYEHIMPGTAMDRYMWEGSRFQDDASKTTCKCHVGVVGQHLGANFASNPIINHAVQYPAGSEAFFHTDYKEVFERHGANEYRSDLTQQSVNPEPGARKGPLGFKPTSNTTGSIEAHLHSKCTISVSIPDATNLASGTELFGHLALHKLNAKAELNPDIIVSYQTLKGAEAFQLALLVKSADNKIKEEPLTATASPEKKTIQIRGTTSPITVVGISVRGPAQSVTKALPLIDIFSLTLKPSSESYSKTAITDVKLVSYGSANDVNFHHRLMWDFKQSTKPNHLPFSDLTGPFSHFMVKAGDVVLGRSYTLGFVIDEKMYQGWKTANKPVHFVVGGFAFDGSHIGTFAADLNLI